MLVRSHFTAMVCVAATLLLTASLQAAKKSAPISKPKFIPDAEVVELFQGMEDKQLHAFLKLKNSKTGNLFVENKTDEPLTVKLPDAFLGVHVLNQAFGGGQGFGGGGQQGGGGGGQTGGGGSQGGGGQFGGGGGQQGGGGAGFFSIPPEKIVRLPVNFVCLEHGKPEPNVRMDYRVVPVEEGSKDPVLKQLLSIVRSGRVSPNAAQAAAWHLANGKSFRELAAMKYDRAGNLPDPPQFSYADLQRAQVLIAAAKQRAKEAEEKGETRPEPPRNRTRSRTDRTR